MKKLIPGLIFLIVAFNALGQTRKNNTEAKEALKKLSILSGKWSGKGWMYVQGGIKKQFQQNEDIQYKLDSTILLIEGVGWSQGEVIHNALAVVSLDKVKKELVFRSYLAEGTEGVFSSEYKDNALYWYPNSSMRYIIRLNEKGQWFEIGEMNRSGNWTKFFEMTLDKIR